MMTEGGGSVLYCGPLLTQRRAPPQLTPPPPPPPQVFGFLLLVFALLVITCAEISIVLTYFQLCSEDYRWWWRSALVPGASGCYLFAYCVWYAHVNLDLAGDISRLLYVGYMGLVALVFSLVTGTVGYLASFAFVTKIYGQIMVD